MQTKKPTTVIAVRVPTDLSEAVREEAGRRNISVNEMLRLDIAAKYHCGRVERNSDQTVQTSDADTYTPEEDDE